MIYSKPRNFIFLRVPKTASTSIQHQILDSIPRSDITAQSLIGYEPQNISTPVNGAPLNKQQHEFGQHINRHPNLETLIKSKLINEDDLTRINVYAVIRDPVDRFIACAHHYYYFNGEHKREVVSNDVAVEKLIADENDHGESFVLVHKQIDWLVHNEKPINKIFRYDQLNLLVKEICGDDVVKYNHRSEYRKHKNADLSLELRQEIRKRYPEDFALWESLQPPADQS